MLSALLVLLVQELPTPRAALGEWHTCAVERTKQYARSSDENADAIARAALGACTLERSTLVNSMVAQTGVSRELATNFVSRLTEDQQSFLMSIVLDARQPE